MAEFGFQPPSDPSYRVERLNNLATAKGVDLRCELTGAPAQVVLISPYASLHYVSKEHALNAWEGVMKHIVHVVGALRSDPPAIGAEARAAQQAEWDGTKLRLVGACQSEASKSCVRGDFQLAIPAAVYALQLLTEVYGEGQLQLVGAHLLLAEANLGARRYAQAERSLTLANWVLVKSPGAPDALRSTLSRAFGKLYASQGRFDDALRHLAEDVYRSSLQFGPEHVQTSGGYFEIAAALLQLGKVEAALAFDDKVVHVWCGA